VVIYPDTSFLVPLYVSEERSRHAENICANLAEPLRFTPFHRLELRSALRGRVFRGSLDNPNLQAALRRNEDHLLDGFLEHTPLVWPELLREAERIGAAHLAETGARSGDLLHVASAVILGAREFLTFDERQAALAKRAGLKVKS
jgi:predicted nucleic acid-binding protein